jgi:Ca-activated chloride channel family protein
VRFGEPLALIALVLVPALAVLYVVRERRRTKWATRWGNPALLPNVVSRSPGARRHLPLVVLLVGLTAMIVGVARPHATVNEPREEATVVLAIDTSRSMKANDVRPTRLDAARAAATAFLDKVPERFRVAVVSFGSRAVVVTPPTEDRELVRTALRILKPGEGTAIGDAVLASVRLGQRERRSDGSVPPTAVLLISDGKQDSGRTTPEAAARRARTLKVPVYTVVVGTPDGVVEEQLQGGYRQIIRVPAEPETLRKLAQSTGGQFFTATNDSRLREVYEQLGSRLGTKKRSREITDVFAGGSALLLLAGGAMSAFWFRRVP